MGKFIKFFTLALTFVMMMSNFTYAQNSSIQEDGNVTVITDAAEIERIMQEENLPAESDEILEIIKVEFPEDTTQQISPRIIFREYYSTLSSSGSLTEPTPKVNYSHPAGNVCFSETYTSSWTLTANAGLKTDIVESAIGYSVTQGNSRTYSWTSEKYTTSVTVKGYLNYNYENRKIYDRDLQYDDYIGTVSTRQDTGYTIVVTKK